ncbi:MAG: ISLre2 family transposase, partial [Anaerolineales bacterium]
ELDRLLTQETAKDPKEFLTQYNYFKVHHEHSRLAYRRFRLRKLPIGSGAVESLIRQVVNLRLKGAGKFWLLETAEAFLHARCQWAAQHWDNYCNAVLTFGLAPPSTI